MFKTTNLLAIIMALIIGTSSSFAAEKIIKLASPDGKTEATINIGTDIQYSLSQDGTQVVAPSQISMTLSDGTVWGLASKLKSVKNLSKDQIIETPRYRSTTIEDKYNGVVMNFTDWSLEFRAFDDAVAYRFISNRDGKYEVKSEQAKFTFTTDAITTAPYVTESGSIENQFFNSFENTYTIAPLSELDKNKLMFLPLSVETQSGKRVTITESDLRDYPGMYLVSNMGQNTLSGVYAPAKNEVEEHSGYNNLQVLTKSRHNFIARVEGERSFPWRVAIISRNDTDLANSSVVYKLAAENVLEDTSWIKPGKVAWDWWNNWNLKGVDFVSGINNDTYKYYIDFASRNNIEYVILDEGWSVNKVYDLMQVVPEIDLKELVEYGKDRNVDIILWAGYYAFDRDMESVCKYYSQMGIKGFKVDFMNGDCQDLVCFNERAAAMCAKYKLLLDIHGTYKPTGLERTYPNLINYEGVHGLEQMKWSSQECDQVTYDVTIPFIRMVAGPMDYTQGAMTNAVRTKRTPTGRVHNQYHSCYTAPMSQGTRMHQLAEYIVFFSPLNMLCDSPTEYENNPISTEFIASTPTIWDESMVVEGKMGEYVITARRSGDRWYIGGLNNWDEREITIDVKAITGKSGTATLLKDGANADNNGADFAKEQIKVGNTPLNIKMASGGGFVVVL